MKKFARRHTALIACLVMLFPFLASPAAIAANTTNFKSNVVVSGTFQAVGGTTMTSITTTGNATVGGNAAVTGNATVTGTLGVTGAVSLTVPLTAANIQTGSAKRQLITAILSPNTGAAADSTVYRATLFPGRAGTVKQIVFGCQTAPTVGTDTIKVLKASSAGNTMLNAATFDANTLVANTGTVATLTATGTDLAITALQPIYCEYSAGAQTVDAIGLTVTIEFEPTDF